MISINGSYFESGLRSDEGYYVNIFSPMARLKTCGPLGDLWSSDDTFQVGEYNVQIAPLETCLENSLVDIKKAMLFKISLETAF